MGYTTEFDGKISITPPLTPKQVAEVNAFCSKEFRSPDGFGTLRPYPSVHCDWWVSTDGSSIGWSGNEKSYSMEKWLPILIRKFFTGHKLNGELHATGEESGDLWTLVCKDNVVSTRAAKVEW